MDFRRCMKDYSYRISWIAFTFAFLTILFIPAKLFLSDDGQPGWDQLPDELAILLGGFVIAVLFLTASFVAGLYAWKKRKIVLLWVVPSGLVVVITGISLLALLVAFLIETYWKMV